MRIRLSLLSWLTLRTVCLTWDSNGRSGRRPYLILRIMHRLIRFWCGLGTNKMHRLREIFTVNLLDGLKHHGLSSSGELSVAENQPVGSTVTSFTATDPDANATLLYYLYDGNGTPGNALFALDLNGTLRTASILTTRPTPVIRSAFALYDEHRLPLKETLPS